MNEEIHEIDIDKTELLQYYTYKLIDKMLENLEKENKKLSAFIIDTIRFNENKALRIRWFTKE